MAVELELVLDCSDPGALAAFWSGALGYRNLGALGQYVVLGPPEGDDGPTLLLQQVPEAKRGKNRMHLDLKVDDVDAEADRLVGLGATKGDAVEEHGLRWIVLADPEGNEVCVCPRS